MQIDDGIFVGPLPKDHEDQGSRSDDGENHDEVRFEPIVALSFVEDDLERSQAKGYEAETDVVDFGFAEFAAMEIWRAQRAGFCAGDHGCVDGAGFRGKQDLRAKSAAASPARGAS